MKWSAPEVLNYNQCSSCLEPCRGRLLPLRLTNSKEKCPAHFLSLYRSRLPELLPETTGVYQESNMEQGKSIRGGVSLCHSLVNEKHCYEVEKALTHCSSTFRKGDIISMINNEKTEDMPPRMFISMLSSRSPILTIHQASTDMEEGQCLESDSIHVFRKEELTLNFKLEMVREECLEAEEENEIEPEWESDDMEDKELVMVSMTETNVAVVRGRGCDLENPCNNCGINGCNVSEVFMEAKNRDVTSVCRGSVSMGGRNIVRDVVMSSLLQNYVKSKQLAFSENVTIYYYQSDITEDGKISYPVVLNLTGTNKFLKCTRNNEEVILTTESYEKDKLKDICKDNPATWPFVFFMKTEDVNNRLFESAENRGWFIRTVNEQGFLWVNKIDESKEPFYFLIYLDTENN
ncbi:hypothetical protein AMEX_G25974 [Astyanax mexicanus]|uniref:Interleukin-1 beta n=2 Tax=Astyanax mexicanus TaxID=7994 RepID=A0A8T2KQW3_ASTMX|nr:hypothetical protein AMEX_G25974 [Astyanax mexicanus]